MKKIFKVMIAFVLIGVLAIGAYFILSGRDNSKLVFQNIYNLTYNVKNGDKNIVEEINNSIDEMQSLITKHSMQLDEVYTNLKIYTELFDYYFVIAEQILQNGNLIKNNNIKEYIALSNNSYKKTIDLYNQSYEYLNDTYYKLQDKNLYIETVKSYIQNFYNIFKDLIPEFNTFYYNSCLAYAYGLENTIQKNNFYKLRVGFYSETINQYYLNQTDKISLSVQALDLKNKINVETAQKYFNNKENYDEIIANVKKFDIGELALKIAIGKESEFYNAIETESQRKIILNYILFVARG